MVLKICDTKRENGMNLNEECLLKYLQNPDELIDLTSLLLEFNKLTGENNYGQA